MLKGMLCRVCPWLLSIFVVVAPSNSAAANKAYMLVQLEPVKESVRERVVNAVRNAADGNFESEAARIAARKVFENEYASITSTAISYLGSGRKIVPFIMNYPSPDKIVISNLEGGKDSGEVMPRSREKGAGVCYGSFVCAFRLSDLDVERIIQQGYVDKDEKFRRTANIGIAYTGKPRVPESWGRLFLEKHYIAENCEFNKRCVLTTKFRRKYAGEIFLFYGDEDVTCLPANTGYFDGFSTIYNNAQDPSWSKNVMTFGTENFPKVTYTFPPLREVERSGCVIFGQLPNYLRKIQDKHNIDEMLLYSAVGFAIVSKYAKDRFEYKVKGKSGSGAGQQGGGIDLRKDKPKDKPATDEVRVFIMDYGNTVSEMREVYESASEILIPVVSSAQLEVDKANGPDPSQVIFIKPDINLPSNLSVCNSVRKHLVALPHNQGQTIPDCKKGS